MVTRDGGDRNRVVCGRMHVQLRMKNMGINGGNGVMRIYYMMDTRGGGV